MKKKWFLGPVIGILALGVISSGVVVAQTVEPEKEESAASSLTSRLADILGLDEAQVEDALEQARTEMENERVQAYLDRLVAGGRITQEQADAYLEWYQARPEGLPFSPAFGGGFGPGGIHGGAGLRSPDGMMAPMPGNLWGRFAE